MKWIRASIVAFGITIWSAATVCAQSPVLRYDPPANFDHSAITPPDDYMSNDVSASIQVYPFRQSDAAIEQRFQQTLLREWIDPRFQEGNVGTLAFAPTAIAGASRVVTAHFLEGSGIGSREHLRFLILAGNQATLVDFSATTGSWPRAVPALMAMMNSMRVETMTTLSAGPPPSEAGRLIAGLYKGVAKKYVTTLAGPLTGAPAGLGTFEQAEHFFLFSADGRVYSAYDALEVPGNEISRFDFDGAARRDPPNSGRYSVNGNEIRIRMGGGQSTVITTTVPRNGLLSIDGVVYARQQGVR